MLEKSDGYAMILFLVLMPVCLILASNLYYATIYSKRSVALLELSRIERRLTEGLLHVGCALCLKNSATLMPWGKNQAQSLQLTFPAWPLEKKSSLSAYSGNVTITSEHNLLTVSSLLCHNNRNCMSGRCTLVYKDPKKPNSPLMLKNWSVK